MNPLELFSTLNLSLAYLDPGSGSIFIQLLISAIVGAAFFIRSKFGSIKNIFKKTSKKDEEDDFEDDLIDE